MKVKVYVNWEDQRVLSEKQFNEMISETIKDKFNDDYELNHYLEWENPHTYSEIFFLTATEKEELYKKFKNYCEEQVEEDTLNNGEWSEKIIEI